MNDIQNRRVFLEMSFAMFNDEHGVPEEAYKHWAVIVQSCRFFSTCVKEFDVIKDLLRVTDGRYYLPVKFMHCKNVEEFLLKARNLDIADGAGKNGV